MSNQPLTRRVAMRYPASGAGVSGLQARHYAAAPSLANSSNQLFQDIHLRGGIAQVPGASGSRLSQPFPQFRRLNQAIERRRQTGRVVRFGKKPARFVDDFHRSAHRGSDHRETRPERFYKHDAERLRTLIGLAEEVGARQ